MQKIIQEILQDLYAIEPTWQADEEELITMIKKLLTSRPEVEMDETFKKELKERLLTELAEKKKRRSQHPFRRVIAFSAAAVATAAVVLLVLMATMSFLNPRRSKQVALDMDKAPGAEPREAPEMAVPRLDDSGVLLESEVASSTLTSGDTEGRVALVAAEKKRDRAEPPAPPEDMNTEEYSRIYENDFREVLSHPLSTFSVDVDTASYANVRRFLNSGRLPDADAVRIEELINYFTYEYPQPEESSPLAFVTELAACPWNNDHLLLHIGLQGKRLELAELPPANLVFLLDVSGSMDEPGKLPLLKQGFHLLTDNLREEDRVAIVVYAGAAGLVLDSTPGSEKQRILTALDGLSAGGSTAGGAGIELAYQVAARNFRPGGNNRIILATDGDFNLGPSSEGELVRLIEGKRDLGIFLTVLGFGSGNYKDAKMEQLADKGNGNYGYIDSAREARKVLVEELGGTLHTIAKDVKLQLEFNPARVEAYRLIGYENRLLAAEDFSDDSKDAGEMGAGHTVTALYELIPAAGIPAGRELKYQQTTVNEDAAVTAEWLTLKFRYKFPEEEQSRMEEIPVRGEGLTLPATSEDFRFAAAVAAWGMLLRDSGYKGESSIALVLDLAAGAVGYDPRGYRGEFLSLVEASAALLESRRQ